MNKEQQREDWLNRRRKRRQELTAERLFAGIKNQEMPLLSAAITLVESTLDSDRQKAEELIRLCLPFSGNSIRIGITGVPGVGKSTFIESFGQLLLQQGKRVAVLAIDPSSGTTGGNPAQRVLGRGGEGAFKQPGAGLPQGPGRVPSGLRLLHHPEA